jgi:hypothetical protein
MYYELELAHLPDGVSSHSADEGEQLTIITSDQATELSGERFFTYIQLLSQFFLDPFLKAGNRLSLVDNCLVLTSMPNRARVYVNEVDCEVSAISARAIQAGEIIHENDITGVASARFPNIEIGPNEGVLYLFTIGWRRAFFFDLTPHHSDTDIRASLEQRIGILYDALLFPKLFALDESSWLRLYEEGWFPFVALRRTANSTLLALIARIQEHRSIENAEQKLLDMFSSETLASFCENFKRQDFLHPHLPFIEQGIQRFNAGDYLSSINNIWPRIEGILRYAYTKSDKPGQKKLLENMSTVLASKVMPTVFFPQYFKDYLLHYYFRDFDLQNNQLEVTRHSIGHGVAMAHSYDRKRALIGLLIIDQLVTYFGIRGSEEQRLAK